MYIFVLQKTKEMWKVKTHTPMIQTNIHIHRLGKSSKNF
jgi:hypothetical protein